MRKIDYIIVHCTASPSEWTKADLKRCFELNGWSSSGYHFAVLHNGCIAHLLPEHKIANGAKGYNANSIHVAYVGGLNGKDTRTDAQKRGLLAILGRLKITYPAAKIISHHDVNVSKTCPNFDATKEYSDL